MATSDWAIPTGKAVTGATYIKDTDDYIAATIEDLVDWCNNANGAYNDWTLTGLRTDFVDLDTAQTITSVKTIDTLGAIDFTNGELRIGGTAVASTASELNILDGVTATTAELNILDGVTADATEINKLDGATASTTELNYVTGVTSSIQTQIDGKASLTGATFTGQVKGITPIAAEDLTRKDYVDSAVSGLSTASGTYTPTASILTNIDSVTPRTTMYSRVGNIVTVSGTIDINATTAWVSTACYITLPISSSLTSTYQVAGNITSSLNGTVSGSVIADTTGNRARLQYYTNDNGTLKLLFTFQYQVA